MTARPKIIFVCGISGVGKSHRLRQFAAHRKTVTVISAGGLIARARETHDRDALRTLAATELDSSQAMLLEGFASLLPTITTSALIIDGHTVIDNTEGDPYLVPLLVFKSLAPDGVVHIESPPEAIAAQRRNDQSRTRPQRSIEELVRHQELSGSRALQIAKELRVPAVRVISGTDAEFCAAMARVLPAE